MVGVESRDPWQRTMIQYLCGSADLPVRELINDSVHRRCNGTKNRAKDESLVGKLTHFLRDSSVILHLTITN
jgi:hypothetical protein